LKVALRDRQHAVQGDLTGETKFSKAADLWIAEVERIRAASTYDTYRRHLAHRILPAFGELQLRECKVTRVHNYLRGLEKEVAPNTARSCRTVVSGVLAFAAQHGAIDTNPVRAAGRIEGGAKPARALTAAERVDFLDLLDGDQRAAEDDLPDLVRYMLGSGVRLGEALGLRWCRVDLDQGVAVHGDNLSTAAGKGLFLKEPKTEAGYRVLPLPNFVLMMLGMRYPGPEYMMNPVFPNALGTWRDRHNTGRSIRKFRKGTQFEWVTSHVFRKTAITIMDQQGLSARSIAGYVGHARPSITQDTYMDKRPEDRRASDAMDRAYAPSPRETVRRYLGGDQS
jgi:integrase